MGMTLCYLSVQHYVYIDRTFNWKGQESMHRCELASVVPMGITRNYVWSLGRQVCLKWTIYELKWMTYKKRFFFFFFFLFFFFFCYNISEVFWSLKIPSFYVVCTWHGNFSYLSCDVCRITKWASPWDFGTYHRRPAKAQARVWPKIRHQAPLDGCACAFEEWVYEGRKVP